MSSIDRLFHCTTHQCGYTCEMLEAGFETGLILRQLDILQFSGGEGNLTYIYYICFVYIYTFSCY